MVLPDVNYCSYIGVLRYLSFVSIPLCKYDKSVNVNTHSFVL